LFSRGLRYSENSACVQLRRWGADGLVRARGVAQVSRCFRSTSPPERAAKRSRESRMKLASWVYWPIADLKRAAKRRASVALVRKAGIDILLGIWSAAEIIAHGNTLG